MTRLEELLYSLTSIIIQYHDSQSKVTRLVEETDPVKLRKKSRALAIDFIEDRVNIKGFVKGNPIANLEKLIAKCTEGYSTRAHFLTFVLHEIRFIRSVLDNKTPIDPSILDKYKLQISLMFNNFISLMSIQKNKVIEVRYSSIDPQTNVVVSLSGLKSDAYVYGGIFCNSGNLVKEDILDWLNISLGASNEEVFEIAGNICTEFDNSLKVPHLSEKIQQLEEEIGLSKKEAGTTEKRLKEGESTALAQQEKIADLEKTILALTKQIDELKLIKPNSNTGISPGFFTTTTVPSVLAYQTMFRPKPQLPTQLTAEQSTEHKQKPGNNTTPSPNGE